VHEEDSATILDRLKRAHELLGGIDALERFGAFKAPEKRYITEIYKG
jgi:hypothetical protein